MGRKRKRGSAVDFKKLERLFVQHATGNTSTLSREDLKTIAREYFDLKDSSNISQKAIDFIRNARKKILMGDVSELVEEDESISQNVLRDPHIAYADLVEADPEKSDSLSNTSKDVVKRACNVIHKVAEKASFTLGLTKEELLETIVAETITHSTSTVKPEMVTVQAKTRQVPELDENTPAAEIEDADGDTHNAEKRSHSPNPLRMMASITTPMKKKQRNFMNQIIKLPIPCSWRSIPINSTKSGKRFGKGWCSVFAKMLSEHNNECCWAFKRNYIQADHSRKKFYPFWQGSASCTLANCGVKIILQIQNPEDNTCNVTYLGNPKHDAKVLSSRRITGNERDALASNFCKDPMLKPGKVYSERLAALDNDQFTSGNRTGVGNSGNAIRLLSSRARHEQRSIAGMDKRLYALRTELRKKDKERAESIGRLKERTFFGYIQDLSFTEEAIRLVMVEEDMVRLYHKVAKCTMFYVDATGGLHEKINSAGRLLYYAMVIPHPFGKGPPIAVAEMIANEHTADSIRRLFQELRYRERLVYKATGNSIPLGIMTDFSLAIIVAAMVEYNNESYRAYLERTYKIMVGLASVEELQKLFVFTCSGHMMKNIKKHANVPGDPENTSKVHLAMRFFGRLINSSSLLDATDVVMAAYIVFKSPHVTDAMETALRDLEYFINTFSPAKNISGDTVEDVGDAESAEASVCTAAEGLTSEEKDLLQAKQTAIKNHWNNRLESLQCKLESTPSTTKVMLCNKYYNPRFMDYCEDYLLPSIALWSKILSGDFQRFNNDYSNFKICRDTSTTGHVERYFGLLKQSKMKPSLDNFVTRHWESRRGAKRSFVDGVTASAGKMSYKKSNMQRAFMRHVKFVQDGQDSDASVEGAWEIPVEEWCKSSPSANSKRGNRLGKYQKPPRTALHFDPVSMNSNVVVDAALSDDSTSPSPKMQSRQSEPQNEPGAHKKISYQRRSSNAFKNFKKSNWPDVIRKSNVSFADCTAKLLSLWESLPDAEKSLYENTKGNDCFCGIEKEAFWVECDLCDKWYHVDCVGLGEEFADDMAYYHCYYCTEKHFRFGMNKLFHSWLTKRAVIDELQEKAEPERLIVETCAQNCAQPHVLVQYADNTIGIRNTFNNCWLNSLVQVVLGTDIYKWLLSRTYARGLNPSNIAAQIAEQLQSGDGKELTVSNNLIKELAVLMGADVNREEQMDIGDCYREVMVRFGNNTLKEYVPLSVLTVANIQYCGRCSHTSGKIEDENSILAQVLQGERDVKYNLKDLLWNSLACGYEFSEDIKCPSCKTAAADSKILNFKGLLEAPVFLPVTLERVNAGSTIPISTRVEIPLVLDMGKSIAGAYSEVIYEFFALIKWCGRRVTSGHYTAYVRDGEATVRVIDDNRIYTKDLKVLNDRATQKGVKMLFYIRKDCRTKENLPNDKLAVSIEERIDISNIVMNDGIRMTGLLGREDITSTLRGARLNGQTLDACLQTLALQDGKDIICFNSYLFELLQNNDITKAVVKKALHTANVKTADVILLPVFRSAGVGHYALMIIYPQLCLMVYADSLLPGVNAEVRNTFMVCLSLMWSFYPKISLSNFSRRYAMVCTDEIERQDDDVSCGIFTCLNAYRFINANKFGVVCRDELKRLRHWICAKGRVATPQVGKASNIARKEYRFIKNKLVELEIQTRLPLGYLQLRMGKPAAALIEKCPIWEQLGRLMQKETLPNYDSDSTDEGNEIFVTAIRRPIEVDMDLFTKCAEELAKIESFSKIDDQAIQARRSDRIKALILLPRGLFRALSEKELLSITESIQQMGISNLLFNTARKLGKKWLTDRNMMAKTCRLGMALLDRVIVPELITEYLAKRYNLRRNELTQEITMGTEGQLLYHVHLKEQECTIARKKITNDDTLYQVIAGKLTDEEVGAIVVGLNQYLEAEESEFLDMMPHEMLRKHLLTETAGRVDQGTVLHVENSDEKHSWSTIFVIEPVYDHEQRRSCINSLEAVVQKCMKIVVEKKLRSIAFAVNPGPNKNWDVHLRLKIITEAVRSQLSKLRSEQGQYISVAIVRFVAENDYFANVAREFISTL